MDNELRLPVFVRASLYFVGMFALLSMLYIGRGIIVPILLSVILAIVLHPVVNLLSGNGINRVLAIIITLILAIAIIAAIGTFFVSQAGRFSESWPKLIEKLTDTLNETVKWASGYFDISSHKIIDWITKTKGEIFTSDSTSLGHTLNRLGTGVVLVFLIPVYVFMLMFYQPLLLEFIRKLFGKHNRSQVSAIITEVKTVIQKYLTGLAIEAVIMATLNSAALLLLGIEYAIMLGIIGAFLNVIPYIGGIVAVALPMMVAFVTKESPWYALYVLAAYYFIQLIDNNYIVPRIVASKVKINALVSIIVVLAFGALWGIPGMFLSIPLTAVVKLIFDHIEPLKPWGYLLGDTMPDLAIFKIRIKIKKKK